VSAKSISVPSMSKKYAQSDRGKGGRGEGRRAHADDPLEPPRPAATVPSAARRCPQPSAAAHRGGVHQHAPRPAKTLKS